MKTEKKRKSQEELENKNLPFSSFSARDSHCTMDHKAASKDQRKATEEARRKLVSYWEEKLDEEGAFEHTFGDPLLTPCTFLRLTSHLKA